MQPTEEELGGGLVVKVLERVRFRLIKIHRYVVKLIDHFALALAPTNRPTNRPDMTSAQCIAISRACAL